MSVQNHYPRRDQDGLNLTSLWARAQWCTVASAAVLYLCTVQLCSLTQPLQVALVHGTLEKVCPHSSTGRADYFGSNVNRAARLLCAAKPGQILVEATVMDAVLKQWLGMSIDSSFTAPGVKGAPEPNSVGSLAPGVRRAPEPNSVGSLAPAGAAQPPRDVLSNPQQLSDSHQMNQRGFNTMTGSERLSMDQLLLETQHTASSVPASPGSTTPTTLARDTSRGTHSGVLGRGTFRNKSAPNLMQRFQSSLSSTDIDLAQLLSTDSTAAQAAADHALDSLGSNESGNAPDGTRAPATALSSLRSLKAVQFAGGGAAEEATGRAPQPDRPPSNDLKWPLRKSGDGARYTDDELQTLQVSDSCCQPFAADSQVAVSNCHMLKFLTDSGHQNPRKDYGLSRQGSAANSPQRRQRDTTAAVPAVPAVPHPGQRFRDAVAKVSERARLQTHSPAPSANGTDVIDYCPRRKLPATDSNLCETV